MTTYLSAIPAYGRDYTSKKAARADWNAGQDFLIQDNYVSGYMNKDDKPSNVTLIIRYAKLTKICVIK